MPDLKYRRVYYADRYPELDFDALYNGFGLDTVFYTKSRHWEYERERRVVCVKHSILAPYYDPLSEIIFGARMSWKNYLLIKSIADRYNVAFKYATRHFSRYEINISDDFNDSIAQR